MIDYLEMMKRADRAMHDVAQLHLHEFEVPRSHKNNKISKSD